MRNFFYTGHRTEWLVVQHSLGLFQASQMVSDAFTGDYSIALINACAVLITASWRIPPAAGEKEKDD
jgi:hypothetical protein